MRTFLIKDLSPGGQVHEWEAGNAIPKNSLPILGSESSPLVTGWQMLVPG